MALTLVLQAGGECYATDWWEGAGLEPPSAFLNPVRPQQHLGLLMARWSLTEPQARCALAVASKDWEPYLWAKGHTWRECVEKWPEQPAFWLGFLGSEEEGQERLIPLMTAPLAERLLRLRPCNLALQLHVLKARPERLSEFLRGPNGFWIAEGTYLERPSSIDPNDRQLVAELLVTTLLQSGELGLAAEYWMEFPETMRASSRRTLFREKPEFNARLALGLMLIGQDAEAALIPAEGEPLLVDLLQWRRTGERMTNAWDAAIAAHDSRRLRGNDLLTLLYPFIAPHFELSDARAVIEAGFASEVTGDSGVSRRRRSARAKSFLRLKAAVEQTPSQYLEPDRTARFSEIFALFLAKHRCPAKVIEAAWEWSTWQPKGRQYQRWEFETPPVVYSCGPLPKAITLNGDDHAYVEFEWGTARVDRDASGKLQPMILYWLTH